MVYNVEVGDNSSVWLLDRGTSNHMIGNKVLFSHLDENVQQTVRLGDVKEVEVLGRGSVAVHFHGGVKLIHVV